MRLFISIFILLIPSLIFGQIICTNLLFDDIDDAATLPINIGDEIASGPFTVEIWIDAVEESQQAQHPSFLSNREPNGQGGVLLFMHDNWGGSEHKMLSFNFEDNNYFNVNCPLIMDESCHYIVFTRRENVLSAYLDGDFIFSQTIPSNFSFKSSESILLGGDRKNSFATPYFGGIEELKFWKRALSASEISDTPYRELEENPIDLVAHYRFISNDPTILFDESDNQFHGFVGDDDQENKVDRSENCCAPIMISSIKESEKYDYSIYPNPTSDELNISVEALESDISYEIYTVLGKKIMTGTIHSADRTINTKHLISGQYYLRLNIADSSDVKSFTICR